MNKRNDFVPFLREKSKSGSKSKTTKVLIGLTLNDKQRTITYLDPLMIDKIEPHKHKKFNRLYLNNGAKVDVVDSVVTIMTKIRHKFGFGATEDFSV